MYFGCLVELSLDSLPFRRLRVAASKTQTMYVLLTAHSESQNHFFQ